MSERAKTAARKAPEAANGNQAMSRKVSVWKRAEASEIFRRRHQPPGSPPGSYHHKSGATEPPIIQFMKYNAERLEEGTVGDIGEAMRKAEPGWVVWIDVQGPPTKEVLQSLEESHGFNPLFLEDVATLGQRPKLEEVGDSLFLIAHWFHLRESLEVEQVSICFSKGLVLSFQEEREGDNFTPIRERVRNGRGNIRQNGADYIAYALLDLLLDSVFPVLEVYGRLLEEIEDEITEHAREGTLQHIHKVKRELLTLRNGIYPLRQLLDHMMATRSPALSKTTLPFLKDAQDHAVQIIDTIDSYKDLGKGLQELYLMSASNRMNEIMKVLTIITTIFMPLGFIASWFGMNFDPDYSPWNMPELRWYLGYPLAIGLALISMGCMIAYFRLRRWL